MSNTPVTDGFNKAKAWWQSRTVWGILLAAVSTIVKALFPEVDIAGAADEVLGADQVASGIDTVWASIGQAVGLVLALWGRIKAKLAIK